MPFLIDGYNLLWSVHKTGEDLEPVSDIQLCYIVGRYLKLVGESGQIVFDGTGPPDKTGFDNIGSLEVFFSGRSTEADEVIENKIKSNTAPVRLTVVSSDRRLRKAARAKKATAVKSETFWHNILRQLNKKKTDTEPMEKRSGITTGETKQWLKFFGIEQ